MIMLRRGAVSAWWAESSPTLKILSVLAVFALISIVFIRSTSLGLADLSAHTDRIIDNDLKRSTIVYSIADSLQKTALAERDLLLTGPHDGREASTQLKNGLEKARMDTDFLLERVRNPERMIMIRSVDVDLQIYKRLSERLVDFHEKGEQDAARQLSSQEIRPLQEKIQSTLTSMVNSYRGDIDENRERMMRESGSLQIGHLLLAIFSVPLICLVAWLSIR